MNVYFFMSLAKFIDRTFMEMTWRIILCVSLFVEVYSLMKVFYCLILAFEDGMVDNIVRYFGYVRLKFFLE